MDSQVAHLLGSVLSSITCKNRHFGNGRKPNKLFQSQVYFIRMKNSAHFIVVNIMLTLCLLWCQLEFELHYLAKQAKLILIKHTVKAPLTFSPDWKRAHVKPSDMELEEHPQHLVDILSRVMAPLPLLLFVCFLSSSSSSSLSSTILPAPITLGPYFTVCTRNRRGRIWNVNKNVNKWVCVCEGQIECVKVCVALCVSTLSGFRLKSVSHGFILKELATSVRSDPELSVTESNWADRWVCEYAAMCIPPYDRVAICCQTFWALTRLTGWSAVLNFTWVFSLQVTCTCLHSRGKKFTFYFTTFIWQL